MYAAPKAYFLHLTAVSAFLEVSIVLVTVILKVLHYNYFLPFLAFL